MRVGGVVFDNVAEAVQSPTTDRAELRGGAAGGDEAERRHRHRRRAGDVAADGPHDAGAKAPGAIVLLSDGKATHGQDPLPVADEAKKLGIPIYTVALGTAAGTLPNGDAVPPDTATLEQIAERSGGERLHRRAGRRA